MTHVIKPAVLYTRAEMISPMESDALHRTESDHSSLKQKGGNVRFQ